jgi:SAM-dependent methyltransferase
MIKAASWRGSANATPESEFLKIIRNIQPSRNDMFYDLGCGYGRLCVLMAPHVKLAVGIEDHYFRFMKARKLAIKSGYKNIKIVKNDVDRISLRKATILYSIIDLGFDFMRKIQRECKPGTIVILYWRTPYPLKSERILSNYFKMVVPLKRVKDENEYARIHTGKKKASIGDVYLDLKGWDAKNLKQEIEEADSNWDRTTA